MLAELPENETLKSIEISQRMNVSHSYLQKIAAKLRKKELIEAQASKQGGYKLKKELEAITFLDIFEAIEGEQQFLHDINLEPIQAMFINQQLVEEKSINVIQIHSEAEQAYRKQLKQHYLVEILPKDGNGNYLQIDWKSIITHDGRK